ncbi:MAG: DinB family protein [Acidobacteria bacterium]|nr:DinB family protein [Acidobacteriota bacterium]
MNKLLFQSMFFVVMIGCVTVEVPAQTEPAPKPPAASAAPATPAAPTTGFRAEFLKQLDAVEKKVIDLAQAMPPDKYSWRPAAGVRSVSEVYMHIAGGNWLIVRALGVSLPAGISRDMEKISDKAKVVDHLKQSFEHVRQAVLGKSDADLDKPAKLFGRETTVRDVFFTVGMHIHEHLGQSIAYARSAGVVPPWSAGAP